MITAPRYAVNQYPVSVILAWVEAGTVAIPEIQRPFLWTATKVRNLLDSLYRGYPIGYLITWQNPDVKLKDGTTSFGKRMLIDGQQRVTALMAAVQGKKVVNQDYQHVRIRIAFQPITREFEVANSAIDKDPAWISDVAQVFNPLTDLFSLSEEYSQRNPAVAMKDVHAGLSQLQAIVANPIGIIDLAEDLDIETVTEIFVRVNASGVPLSQADFAMSKIAVNEEHDGDTIRKAIDYFCHLAVAPAYYTAIETNDPAFTQSHYWPAMQWLKKENDDLYDPSYTDMLRVALMVEFSRGQLKDLVSLLSGRNTETKQYEEAIIEDSFQHLSTGIYKFMNETSFKNLIMTIRSAGFVDASMVTSQNTLDFAYGLFLTLQDMGLPKGLIQKHVAKWFVMSLLTGRYSGSTESTIDRDIRQIREHGIVEYAQEIYRSELSEGFWEAGLVQALDTSSSSSPLFRVFEAAQVKMGDKGFLSQDLTVSALIAIKSDVHHIFPKEFLKSKGFPRTKYNQIANYVVTQSEINIAIGKKEPRVYFAELREQCNGGPLRYGTISDAATLAANLRAHCIPESIAEMTIRDYESFLQQRRVLMARKMRAYFESL
ncbi:MAG: DUF262 domain-containing protein [Anaerolineales bacterium]